MNELPSQLCGLWPEVFFLPSGSVGDKAKSRRQAGFGFAFRKNGVIPPPARTFLL